MIQFHAAPPVPIDYPRLWVLTAEEISLARESGYVADNVDITAQVQRSRLNNCDEPPAKDDLQDWRTRMYVVWFCYIYENFLAIDNPLFAIEELIFEFKGLGMIDYRLASLYAGAGAEKLNLAAREKG